MRRSTLLLTALLTLSLVAVALPGAAQEAKYDPCDANQDGTIDMREREACSKDRSAPQEPPRDPCMGRAADKDACAAALKRCDVNGDGKLDDAERKKCAEERRAEHEASNPDGADKPRDERKPDAEWPDRTPREEKPHTTQAEDDHGVSAECKEAIRDVQEQRARFHAGLEERRKALALEEEKLIERFAAENRTDEEWARLKQELSERREAAEKRFGEEIGAFERGLGDAARACHGRLGQDDTPAKCIGDDERFARFRSLVEDEERRYLADAEARLAAAKERAEAARKAFAAENHTPEETEAFEANLRKEVGLLAAEIEQGAREHRAALERKWIELKANEARDCIAGHVLDKARAFAKVHGDLRDERLECGLDIQARFDAFHEKHGRDESVWDAEALRAYAVLKDEARDLREACERRLHADWKQDVQDALGKLDKRARLGSFELDASGEGTGHVAGRFVAFGYDGGDITVRDYTVQGVLLFESFHAPFALARAPDADGSVLKIAAGKEGAGAFLRIHDAPTGGFDARCVGDDATQGCVLRLAAGAAVEKVGRDDEGAQGYRVAIADRMTLLHVHGEHRWNGGTLDFLGALRLVSPSENFVLQKVANKEREKINAAVEARKVLAEVTIAAGADRKPLAEFVAYDVSNAKAKPHLGAADACGKGDEAVRFELDGLKCGAVKPRAQGAGLDIVISAESADPKTLVFNLDNELFALDEGALKLDDVKVAYFEVADDGSETEVAIRKASDIADVLDPDEDAPEYWVVLDEDGLQLLVSNPHFSTKRISVAAAPAEETPGSGGAPMDPADTAGADATKGTPFPGALALVVVAGVIALARRARR